MRLRRCHIENFGKLQNYTLDFSENPVVVNEKNGWGKSTLAAFIKVMFYGFANEKKRGDAIERERVRFKPWQGGVCGGELEFEAGGRRYLLNRTFGVKEAEDTFALYDAATNLKSEDFSANIGEELFQINQESFLRTIYIAQNDCATSTTDSINAKMGNLAENLDDINRYEKVQQVLKDLRNSLTPSRKTGALRKMREEIDDLKNEIRRAELTEKSIAELEARLIQCRDDREAALHRQEALQEELAASGRRKEAEAKREHYERILRRCRERQEAVSACEAFFKGSPPAREELQKAMDRQSVIVQRESDMQANELTAAEREAFDRAAGRFAAGVPAEEAFVRGRRLAEELDGLRGEAARYGFSAEEEREAEQLKKRFDGRTVREEEIDRYLKLWNRYSDLKSGLETKRAALSALKLAEESAAAARGDLRREQERRRRRRAFLYLLPIGLLFAGLALCFSEAAAGIALIAAAAGAAVFLAVSARGRGRMRTDDAPEESGAAALEAEIADDEEAAARMEEQVLHFLRDCDAADGQDVQGIRDALYAVKDDLRRLERFLARQRDYQEKGYEERIRELEKDLDALLQPYFTAEELREKRADELLFELEHRKRDYLRLAEKREKHRRAAQARADGQAFLAGFFAEHGRGDVQDAGAELRRMNEKLAAYEKDAAELEQCVRERRAFEEANDASLFTEDTSGGTRSMEEVKAELQAAAEELEKISDIRNSYFAQLDERQQEAEELEGKRERLARLEEEYADGCRYYRNLELASEYLARAKESFSARYMEPIMRAFQENYEMISRLSGEDFRMDAAIRLTKREAGEQRDTRALSAGSQDLVGIALRMALIEAMYRKEKPFLIFDDSFVNLDDEKLEYAKEFLRKTAEKYQVIYFTCHGSRAREER